jgi:hypothetical protein
VLFVGLCLSQTGGHGDWREPHHRHAPIEGVDGLFAAPRICDSSDEMRRAAREVLRTGAHAARNLSAAARRALV